MKRPIQKQDRYALIGLLLIFICASLYVSIKLRGPQEEPSVPVRLSFNGTVPAEIIHGDTTKKQVIFTFDCGGSTESADAILSTLTKHHVKGSFFVTGKFAEKYPDIVKRMVSEGNEIFNHTDSHPHLTEIPDWQIRKELATLDKTVFELTGQSTVPYFRAPYGDRDARVLKVAAELGYQSVYWSNDALDWEQSKGMTAQEVHDRILANMKPGVIYLMHVGDSITGQILDQVFTDIEAKGYKEVSLTQGLPLE